MKKTYYTPEILNITLQSGDIMTDSIEGFNLFGIGYGDEQGFAFPKSSK